jgi:hypothetical protein
MLVMDHWPRDRMRTVRGAFVGDGRVGGRPAGDHTNFGFTIGRDIPGLFTVFRDRVVKRKCRLRLAKSAAKQIGRLRPRRPVVGAFARPARRVGLGGDGAQLRGKGGAKGEGL